MFGVPMVNTYTSLFITNHTRGYLDATTSAGTVGLNANHRTEKFVGNKIFVLRDLS